MRCGCQALRASITSSGPTHGTCQKQSATIIAFARRCGPSVARSAAPAPALCAPRPSFVVARRSLFRRASAHCSAVRKILLAGRGRILPGGPTQLVRHTRCLDDDGPLSPCSPSVRPSARGNHALRRTPEPGQAAGQGSSHSSGRDL